MRKKLNLLIALLSLLAVGFFFTLPSVSLADLSSGATPPLSSGATPPLSSGNTTFVFQNPLNATSFCGLIHQLLNAILLLGAPIAMLALVYSGFLFVAARGNPTALTAARKNLLWVIIGIGIFLGAWALGQIVAATINQLASQTGNPAVAQCS